MLCGNNIRNDIESNIENLQKIENKVYRQILGGQKHTATCALRGETGTSLLKIRMMKDRLSYIKHMKDGKNELLKTAVRDMQRKINYKWTGIVNKYIMELKLKNGTDSTTREQVEELTREWNYKNCRLEWTNITFQYIQIM